MNEDKTYPEEVSTPDTSASDLNLLSSHENPTRPGLGDQQTVITTDNKLIKEIPIDSNVEVNRANTTPAEAPWISFLKWFGPVTLACGFFLAWIIFDRVKQQKGFAQTSEINSLLLQSVDSLANDKVSESALMIEKVIAIVPKEEKLQNIYVALHRKINAAKEKHRSPQELTIPQFKEPKMSAPELNKVTPKKKMTRPPAPTVSTPVAATPNKTGAKKRSKK